MVYCCFVVVIAVFQLLTTFDIVQFLVFVSAFNFLFLNSHFYSSSVCAFMESALTKSSAVLLYGNVRHCMHVYRTHSALALTLSLILYTSPAAKTDVLEAKHTQHLHKYNTKIGFGWLRCVYTYILKTISPFCMCTRA